jgi:hypothetical protein
MLPARCGHAEIENRQRRQDESKRMLRLQLVLSS